MATRPRLRVGIVGAGMIGRAHAHAFRALPEFFQPAPADVELAVVADAVEPLARDAQARFGFERTASSWEEVVEARDVDAVVVALPNHQHRQPVEALLAAGKHVLCEKPLAPTAAESWALLQAARRSGMVHGIGFNLRRTAAIAAIQQIVARGDFGELRHFSGRYFTDYAQSPETPFTWRYRRAQAGSGALGDVGSHMIDIARFVVGEIESVQGAALQTYVTRRPVPAGHVIGHARAVTTGQFETVDTDDVATLSARFVNGVVADMAFSRIATGYRNSPAFSLIGERAAASFDFERGAGFQYFDASHDDDVNGFRRVVLGPLHPYLKDVLVLPVAGVGYGYTETYLAQAWEFVRAITQGVQGELATFEDGYAATLVCDAAIQSAAEGRRVRIAEVAAGVEGR